MAKKRYRFKDKGRIGDVVSQSNSGQKIIGNIVANEADVSSVPIIVTPDDIQDSVDYQGGITSIDFMMPEQEREILEKNLNLIDNQEELQKALIKAEKNAAMKQKIRTLNMIDYLTDLIDDTSAILAETVSRDDIRDYITRMIEEGDLGKALKEIGIMNKANIDARNELLNGINNGRSKKQAKIAVKFTNNSGEETAIFVEG